MAWNWPIDVPADDWTGYGFWLVTWTTRESTTQSGTVYAANAADARTAVLADLSLNQLFGPVTIVSAVSTTVPGVA